MTLRPDLTIIVVSTNEVTWLDRCLTTVYEHAGDVSLDVIVVDNNSVDGTADFVRTRFPEARVVWCENHGFGHANNRAIMSTNARYVLLLNPDTEIVSGTFEQLVAAMDARPEVGLAGVKQLDGEGNLFPTIRRRPHALRTFVEAMGSERLPVTWRGFGERELRPAVYEREVRCDWTSGSFMLIRSEALQSAGLLDERSFIYAEEPDLCRRIQANGWEVRHLPLATIIHHAGKAGIKPKLLAQDVWARLHYGRKHMSLTHRAFLRVAIALKYGLRLAYALVGRQGPEARRANVAALRVLFGLAGAPFETPPRTALRPLESRQSTPARDVDPPEDQSPPSVGTSSSMRRSRTPLAKLALILARFVEGS